MAVYNNAPYLPKYRTEVLRNGVTFENDRKFKNQLIIKTILLMTVLVVSATCGFVAWSKLRVDDLESSLDPVHITTIFKKVAVDDDDIERSPDLIVFSDVRTEFVPSFAATLRHSRLPRDLSKINTNVSNDDAETYEEEEELLWVKVAEKTKRNVKAKTQVEGQAMNQANLCTQRMPPISLGQGDAETVRKRQAERMKSYMDDTIDPCEDFYEYACGNWDHYNSIPEDRSYFDTFEILRDSLDAVLRDLLLEGPNPSAKDPKNITAIDKAKIYFRSCINEGVVEKRGNEPLLDLIESLGGWPILEPNWNETNFDWVKLAAKLRIYFNDILIQLWVGPDWMASSNYIVQFDQISLALPTKDYFLKDENKIYKDAYKTYIYRVAILLGADIETAGIDAEAIVAFETELANITASPDERRNISLIYEKVSISRLEKEIPQIDWRRYLSIVIDRDVEDGYEVVLFARKYFIKLGDLLRNTPARTVANYVLWRFVKYRTSNLGLAFQDVKQDFYHTLIGRKKSPPRWNICVHYVNSHMGMALGAMFVKRYFDENSKNNTVAMTKFIMESFSDMLEELVWIDDDTRRVAKNKVDAIILRIGYPDFVLDYEELNSLYANVNVTENFYFENTLNILNNSAILERNRLGTLVDKWQWNTPPATVNAYYSRNKNQILFPAGILQPPFYHQYFPRSVNYGGIGVVIGHEIIHGFDDKGRLYDLEGNLNRWWSEDAINNFRYRTKCLIDQYNSYVVPEINMRVDGVNTQGENIADNGGIKQAFRAYERWVAENGDEGETLPGINATNYQLFFINFAQVWCGASRPEAARNKIQTAVHPPGKFRVIGTLSNSEDFARVFNCPKETYMNPKDKCRVW